MNDNLGTESRKSTIIICFILFVISFIVFQLTREGPPTQFNNFVLLADAISNGHLYLPEPFTWLELASYEGRYYIVPPPMPAILLLPAVALFGLSTDQTLVSIFFGAINVSLAYLVAKSLTANRKVQIWTAAMFGFGTISWWVTTAGGVWTFSSVISVTFLFIAILLTLHKAHPFLSGLALGASYWSRLPTILSFPFFLFMYAGQWYKSDNTKNILKRIDIKPIFFLGLGAGIFVILNALYNYVRFDTPFDVSYYLIPGILDEPWYQKGIFDISYIPRHLKVIFTGFPNFSNEFPYVTPSWNGLAIWITTPAFVYAFFAGIRNKMALGAWVSIILIAFVDFCHGTWGFSQFGYRFAVDFYPFLFLLTVKGIGDELRWHHKTLISLGILVNLWGVLWIHKFGWVGY